MSSPTDVTSPQAPGVRPSRSRRRPKESSRTPFDDDPTWRLFITTNGQIKAWDQSGCETVFKSSSHGIVAAKRARDGSTVAIADAQVVMLHNYKETQEKTYRLKGTQRCRLLQYSRDSRNLFFTDALHNSVQAYRLAKNTVSEATAAHPSPITCFAVSCDSNLIVSASAKPPVTHVYNQMHSTTMSLVPTASSATVVSCAFHPTRRSIFVLAFGDGVLAAYDYNSMSKSKTKQDSSFSIPRCSAKAIHAFQHLHDPSINGSAGITGVEFLPGAGSRAITIGEDGRCFLVDFEQRSTVASWHIGAPATSLTIREVAGGNASRKSEPGVFLLAVGTIHGRCVVYDGNANKVAEKIIDKDGEPVLDVEWVHGSIDIPEHILSPAESRAASPDTSAAPSDPRKALATGSIFGNGKDPSVSLPPPLVESDGNIFGSEQPHSTHSGPGKRKELYEELADTAEQGYMALFSPVKKKRTSKPSSLPDEGGEPVRGSRARFPAVDKLDQRSVISAPLLWDEKSGDQPVSNIAQADKTTNSGFDMFKNINSPINQSPSLSQSDQSLNASVIATGSAINGPAKVQEKSDDGKLLNEIRSIRANVENARAARAAGGSNTLAAIAPYLPSRIRSVPNKKAGTLGAKNRSVVSAPGAANGKTRTSAADVPSQNSSSVDIAPERSMAKDATSDERTEDEQCWPHTNSSEPRPGGEQAENNPPGDEEDDIWLIGALPEPPTKVLKPPTSKISSSLAKLSKPESTVPPSSSAGNNVGDRPTRSTSNHTENTYISSSHSSRSVGWSASPPQILPASTSSHPTVSTTSSTDVSTVTASESLHHELAAAIAAMQSTLSQQINEFQLEVQQLFQEQNREILELRQEVGRLWNENIGLRKSLEDAGVVGVAGDAAIGGMRRRSSSLRR